MTAIQLALGIVLLIYASIGKVMFWLFTIPWMVIIGISSVTSRWGFWSNCVSGFQPNLRWVKGVDRSFQKFDIHPARYLIYEMESKVQSNKTCSGQVGTVW